MVKRDLMTDDSVFVSGMGRERNTSQMMIEMY